MGLIDSCAQVKSYYGMIKAKAVNKNAKLSSELGSIYVKVAHKKAKVESQFGIVDIANFYGLDDLYLQSISLFKEERSTSFEVHKLQQASMLLKENTC